MKVQLTTGSFFGTTVRQREVAGFALSETHYAPGTALPYHSHESHYFGLVLNGTYRERYGRRARSCSPSTISYHPAGEKHAQYFGESAVDLFRIEISQELPTPRSRKSDHNPLAIGFAHGLYREFCAGDALSDLAIQTLGLELLRELIGSGYGPSSTSRLPPVWLARAYELISARYLDHLTLSEIASSVGVHPMTLVREFRRNYGSTVVDTIRRLRMRFACEHLASSPLTIADIALAAGYYDQSHFTKTFRKLVGLTPADYRLLSRRH